MTTKVKKLKARLGFHDLSDPDLLKQLNTVHDGMNGNPVFSNPPHDMAAFKAGIDKFTVLVSEAEDGGRKAIAARRKQREEMVRQVTHLGHYVEAASHDDPATFITSGFVMHSAARTPPQPLPPTSFDWIDRGPSAGVVVVKPKTLPGAINYDVRYGVIGNGGTPPALWTTVTLPGPKKATIANLAPGTNYAFQIRAFGRLGHSDWSDSMTFICG